jgi:hypothetical protein
MSSWRGNGGNAMAKSWTLALLGGIALSACSPYVYNQEITGFSTGVNAVAASYQTGQQAVDAIAAQQWQAANATARTRLLLLPGCDQTDPSGSPPKLPDCAIVAFSAKAAPAPTAVQQNLADAAPAFNALKAYAAALTAVTAAADETALNQASQSLTTAANGLAGTVAKLAPAASPASGFVAPIGSLIGQAVTLYLDQRRLAVLRSAVPAVDPDVQVLGQTVQAALLDIRAQQLLQLGTGLRSDAEPLEVATVSKLSTADYQSKLAALQVGIAAFNQTRAADPTATVAAMVTAHHQLAAALQANSGEQMAVLTAVQTFATAAAQLKTAVVAADTARPATAAGK